MGEYFVNRGGFRSRFDPARERRVAQTEERLAELFGRTPQNPAVAQNSVGLSPNPGFSSLSSPAPAPLPALIGDVDGPITANVVNAVKGQDWTAGSVANTVPVFDATQWVPGKLPITGDVSGNHDVTSVDKAKGIPLPTAASVDDGEVLAYVHGTPAYVLKTPPFKVFTTAIDLTVGVDHMVVLVDATTGNRTITLPAAAVSAWKVYVVKKIDLSANTVTIDGDAAETIDGAATQVIAIQYNALTIVCDGVTWWII